VVESAVNANTGGTPQRVMMRPAIAGPIARDTLTLTMSSWVALEIWSRGTSSVISGCQVGNCIAMLAPMANVKPSRSAGGTRPRQVSRASSAETMIE